MVCCSLALVSGHSCIYFIFFLKNLIKVTKEQYVLVHDLPNPPFPSPSPQRVYNSFCQCFFILADDNILNQHECWPMHALQMLFPTPILLIYWIRNGYCNVSFVQDTPCYSVGDNTFGSLILSFLAFSFHKNELKNFQRLYIYNFLR